MGIEEVIYDDNLNLAMWCQVMKLALECSLIEKMEVSRRNVLIFYD